MFWQHCSNHHRYFKLKGTWKCIVQSTSLLETCSNGAAPGEQIFHDGFDSRLELIDSFKSKIKSSLYSRYYAEVCNEWRAISVALRLGSTAMKKRRGGGVTVSNSTGPEIELKTSRTNSNVFNHYVSLQVISWTSCLQTLVLSTIT